MKFLMFVCSDIDAPVPGEGDTDPSAWVEEMDAKGVRVFGDRLADASEARTLRVRGGQVRVTDGPFTEAKETIGGFDVLECASLEEAVEVASKHQMAQYGAIEVRAFYQW